MKKMKFSVCAMSVALLLSSCGGMSNTAKGGLIGGASGGALGALVGQFIGKGKGAAIGAAVGTAVGAGAGVLIGNKMDKAKKAAEAAQAEAEILTDAQGTQYVKATFDSGLLFQTSSSALNTNAKAAINKFVNGLLAEDNTFELAVAGFTDNAGWRNSTAEQSKAKNLNLSQQRADAVKAQIVGAGYPAARLVSVKGYGEENPVADNSTAAGKAQNRRVEVYILPSADMIKAANAQAAK
ncbi:MAG: OmpA family protein [Prevotellamassilia sp.]